MIGRFTPQTFMEYLEEGERTSPPQLVFVRATEKEKSIDISFQIHQLKTIIESLTTIQNENEEYFDEL